jgi:hypothetical protein
MKGIDSTGAHFVHVPGWMGGWMDGSKSRFKDCLQQSTKQNKKLTKNLKLAMATNKYGKGVTLSASTS